MGIMFKWLEMEYIACECVFPGTLLNGNCNVLKDTAGCEALMGVSFNQEGFTYRDATTGFVDHVLCCSSAVYDYCSYCFGDHRIQSNSQYNCWNEIPRGRKCCVSFHFLTSCGYFSYK
ncbi:hypothetical protein BCR33DRAFT_495147 [Rhizoclosmatium globosum]|uniref:Uncharacterized protein n=1 Tax=Rhizoclosmatium globosum TaxID=329046 RepID=A0A1Y2CUQ5_9FUNG|nr:hypothetical protein BCR33DRAFT_495147 [Rhizoclosmatium globosum]|eukprot:ORY50789.1 hypothetical protein BCR33DRAFT_495147 [Rhizoclosmatium globosum]